MSRRAAQGAGALLGAVPYLRAANPGAGPRPARCRVAATRRPSRCDPLWCSTRPAAADACTRRGAGGTPNLPISERERAPIAASIDGLAERDGSILDGADIPGHKSGLHRLVDNGALARATTCAARRRQRHQTANSENEAYFGVREAGVYATSVAGQLRDTAAHDPQWLTPGCRGGGPRRGGRAGAANRL